jgi:hypothetical protein
MLYYIMSTTPLMSDVAQQILFNMSAKDIHNACSTSKFRNSCDDYFFWKVIQRDFPLSIISKKYHKNDEYYHKHKYFDMSSFRKNNKEFTPYKGHPQSYIVLVNDECDKHLILVENYINSGGDVNIWLKLLLYSTNGLLNICSTIKNLITKYVYMDNNPSRWLALAIHMVDKKLTTYILSKGANLNVDVQQRSIEFIGGGRDGHLPLDIVIGDYLYGPYDESKYNPLSLRIDFMKFLIRNGASKVHPRVLISTAEMGERWNGDETEDVPDTRELFDILLSIPNINVNYRSTLEYDKGRTAIMNTTKLNILRKLLDKGADPTIRDNKGKSAYDYMLAPSEDTPCPECIELFKSYAPSTRSQLTGGGQQSKRASKRNGRPPKRKSTKRASKRKSIKRASKRNGRSTKRASKRKSIKRASKRKSIKRASKRKSIKRASKRKSIKRASKRKSTKRASKRKSIKSASKRKSTKRASKRNGKLASKK